MYLQAQAAIKNIFDFIYLLNSRDLKMYTNKKLYTR